MHGNICRNEVRVTRFVRRPRPLCLRGAVQIHKLMAGLLDAHLFMGNDVALTMVKEEAAFFLCYIDNVIAVNGTAHWHQMLEDEFGGMNEVLFNLYDVTHNPEHLRCAPNYTSC